MFLPGLYLVSEIHTVLLVIPSELAGVSGVTANDLGEKTAPDIGPKPLFQCDDFAFHRVIIHGQAV